MNWKQPVERSQYYSSTAITTNGVLFIGYIYDISSQCGYDLRLLYCPTLHHDPICDEVLNLLQDAKKDAIEPCI